MVIDSCVFHITVIQLDSYCKSHSCCFTLWFFLYFLCSMLVSSIIQVCYKLQQFLRSGGCESPALVMRGVGIQVSIVVILWVIVHLTLWLLLQVLCISNLKNEICAHFVGRIITVSKVDVRGMWWVNVDSVLFPVWPHFVRFQEVVLVVQLSTVQCRVTTLYELHKRWCPLYMCQVW